MGGFRAGGLMCGALLGGVLCASAAQAAPVFVDARDYTGPGGGHERFLAAERQLVRGFDAVCGDTFCEGQYINLWAMRLRCSVERATGVVAQCVWTFAGSDTRVHTSGLITVDRGRFACVLPLAPGTRLEALLQAWETGDGHDALRAPLPGTTGNTYDALVDCL
ncbi:hypothetical protein ARC23_15360 [Stenotrophomonas beteli]|uniref:Secreted protein n=2 Tax=Stenotrophomonas beteli TaxID=3384461 RepID=A0A0R0B6P0_9GAMM|nr:hypothetical protein ARC23_15360 [Stenotrophomonas maltophilia]